MNAKEKTTAYLRQERSDENNRSAEEQLDKLKSKITSMESIINTDIEDKL
jgi:hypothetical protein